MLTLSENPNPAALSSYGWRQFSHVHWAVAICGGFSLYGLFSSSLRSMWSGRSASEPDVFVWAAAFALPAIGAAISLRSRRVRMASELLRPASRTAYFDGLFKSLTGMMLSLWLATTAGLGFVLTFCYQMPQGNFPQLAVGYLLLSLAVQLPAFALGLRMAQWRSPVLFSLGCYGLAIAELGLFFSWITVQKEAGPILVAVLAAILLIALGVPLWIGARNDWLRTELG